MDFNSNDEYLKAYPPNFGPKIARPKKKRMSRLDFCGVSPKDSQENVEAKPVHVAFQEPVHLEEECVDVQEPIQVDTDRAENNGDESLQEQEEMLILSNDPRCSERLEIDEPMPQMVEMPLVMEVQREDEMVEMTLDEGDAEGLEAVLLVEAIEETALEGDIEVKGSPSTVEPIDENAAGAEATQPVQTKEQAWAPVTTVVDGIEDPALPVDATERSEAEISILAEGVSEVATMEAEIESVESTRVFTEFERHTTVDDAVDGNAIETETLSFVKCGQSAITIELVDSVNTLDPIEFEVSTQGALEEASENADAIEAEETVTLETITRTPTSQKEPSGDTEVEVEAVGITDPSIALEVVEKTSNNAKAVCQDEGEEIRFTIKVIESTSTSIPEVGTDLDADVDRIVDSIMNDAANIEANMEANIDKASLEAGIESNTQHQKRLNYEKPVWIESEETCRDHVDPSGGHG